MFALNRLRGMYGWADYLLAFAIACIMGTFEQSWYTFGITFALVLVGNVFGWGDWFGAILNGKTKPTPYTEGKTNGIQWLAEKIISSDKNWIKHCQVALIIRGSYRAVFFLALGYWVEFLFLTPMLLASLYVGKYTAKKFNFKHINGGWEHSEVWYGLFLDVILICAIIK